LVTGELNPVYLQRPDGFSRSWSRVLAQRLAIQLGSSSAIFAAGLARLGNNLLFVGKIGRITSGSSAGVSSAAGVNVNHVIVDSRWPVLRFPSAAGIVR
jgi:sugar/nucleoside kinase (ribokinase family)